jgi:hypothetical protein
MMASTVWADTAIEDMQHATIAGVAMNNHEHPAAVRGPNAPLNVALDKQPACCWGGAATMMCVSVPCDAAVSQRSTDGASLAGMQQCICCCIRFQISFEVRCSYMLILHHFVACCAVS